MTSDSTEYPLMGIPIPFRYQVRESGDSVVEEMDLLLCDEPAKNSSKRAREGENEASFDSKRARGNCKSPQRSIIPGNSNFAEDIVPTSTQEPSFSTNSRHKSTPHRNNSPLLLEGTKEGLWNGKCDPQYNQQSTQCNNCTPVDDTPAIVANNNSVTNGNGTNPLVSAQNEEGLPLSPIASPSCSPSGAPCSPRDAISQQDYLDLVASTAHSRLSPSAFQNLVFQLVSKLTRSELSDLGTLVKDNLKRDLISSLPLEVSMNILTNLGFEDISRCLSVNRTWNSLINNTSYLWRKLMVTEGFISQQEFKKYSNETPEKLNNESQGGDLFRVHFLENQSYLKNWYNGRFKPHRTTLRGHTMKIVTCLQFEDDYVITGADDKMIRVYDVKSGRFLAQLSGHDGGVWALKYGQDGILVSGSTDRSVRVWNIKTGKCTHVFKGHTSTVRCLDIVEHNGEKFIITGSRDHTLHVWRLPNCHSENYDPEVCEIFNTTDTNPYFVGVLRGHMAAVRTVSGHGNIVISGSYDFNLMVWDIAKMKCLYVLTGHTDRIYSTIYDYTRNRCISAGMDSTIKVWDLQNIQKNGHCTTINSTSNPCTKVTGSVLTLQGHTALVGLLGLSDKFLVSAAADGTLRGWDSDNYSRQFAYHHKDLSAITTFYVNDNILVSGSEGQFNVYNLRSGKLIHSDLLSDADQIWSVKFDNRRLVAAVERDGRSFVEFLDFGRPEQEAKVENLPYSSEDREDAEYATLGSRATRLYDP